MLIFLVALILLLLLLLLLLLIRDSRPSSIHFFLDVVDHTIALFMIRAVKRILSILAVTVLTLICG